MGPLQCGLPNPNLIPNDYQLFIVDLKDCFFTIPLAPTDKEKFAFTVPVLNNQRPTQRFHWNVLPQGMLNSPTLCQKFVDNALTSFRQQFPTFLVYHYMDDILVSAPILTSEHLSALKTCLANYGLYIAPEKIQLQEPYKYLGFKMLVASAVPNLPSYQLKKQYTLVEFQQLLGTLNWVRPYFKLPTSAMLPFFQLLKGHSSPCDIIQLDSHLFVQMQALFQTLSQKFVDRIKSHTAGVCLALLPTPSLSTGCLYVPSSEKGVKIIEWLHLSATPPRNVYSYLSATIDLIMKARHRSLQLIGQDLLIISFTRTATEHFHLMQTSDAYQIAFANFVGQLEFSLPHDPRFILTMNIKMSVNSILSKVPLKPPAITVFTDGCATRGIVVWKFENSWKSSFTARQTSAQRAELAAAILALHLFPNQPLNIILDSLYVFTLFSSLSTALFSTHIDSNLMALFLTLQNLLRQRCFPLFLAHIRSHTSLPGFLTEGNAFADSELKNVISLFSDPIESHAFFHQSAKSLVKMFSIPLSQAQAIVRSCTHCASSSVSFSMGVNPRGTKANQLWQMDVTHFAP